MFQHAARSMSVPERRLAAYAVAARLQVEMVAVNGVVVRAQNTAEKPASAPVDIGQHLRFSMWWCRRRVCLPLLQDGNVLAVFQGKTCNVERVGGCMVAARDRAQPDCPMPRLHPG